MGEPKRYPSDRRERALALVKEGKFGGPKFAAMGGKRRVERAHARVAAVAAKHEGLIEAAFVHALKNGSTAQRLAAAEALTRLALAADRSEVGEQVEEAEQMSRDELIATLSRQLAPGSPVGEVLRARIEVIEGEASEIADNGR
jgi:hypothetical protein